MAENKSYEQQLRNIGQSLEAQRIREFELRRQGERIVVKGEPEKETSLLAALRNWQKRVRREALNGSLEFSSHDVEELERQGRAQRSQPNRLPDFHRLPNTLRTVGSYLDLKGSRLLELHKHQLGVTLLCQSQAGHPEFEERSIASFYDLFVQMHGRRGKTGSIK
ncbi:MAG TPA: hypothetical protein VLA17_16680 [Candidatus Limnocylindria bacterium]|nr:hypothetical protein [Candidatus Limnocylindria bacterium]